MIERRMVGRVREVTPFRADEILSLLAKSDLPIPTPGMENAQLVSMSLVATKKDGEKGGSGKGVTPEELVTLAEYVRNRSGRSLVAHAQ